MAKRGRIVRDPTAGAGLVIVQGRQHSFGLENVWKSDALPRPGVVVDVEFDDSGRVTAMTAVPEARLAKEQAEAAIALATAKGTRILARLGLRQLAALGALAVGWFWLSAIDVDGSFRGQSQLTFWQALGVWDTTGVYGSSALVCLAAPLLTGAWNDRRAHLAAVLPLGFVLAVAWPLVDLASQAGAAVSLGAGAFVSVLAGLYLALSGVKRFLVAAAHDTAAFYENQ